jgi:biopolymer transport protein TolR
MLQKGVDVRLPLADNTVDKPETQEQTVVAIDSRNGFHVNGIAVDRRDLADRVKRALDEKNERIVLIKGDTEASYSAVMSAMDDLRKAGIEDIGLITDPKTPPSPNQGGR